MSIYQVFDTAKQQIARGAASGTALFKESITTDDLEIRRLLNSTFNRDKAIGLRSLLTKVADGVDCHEFFADVVKNIYSADLEVREMATSFLILYSQHEPELTLMIVNSVQRMLGDRSSIVRLQALRLASALRVPTVAPIVTHLITQVVNDVSPLVRAACFQAIGKCYEIDPSLGGELLELLGEMLASPKQLRGDYQVAGWGLAMLAQHWPQRLDIIHPIFRWYVPHLRDFDEWCQIVVCRMLVRYCRHFLVGPNDDDSRLLCESVIPLLSSNNNAVVAEAAAVILYVGTEELFESAHVARRLLNLQPSTLTWSVIAKFCHARPTFFVPYRSEIILNLMPSDPPGVKHYALRTAIYCRGPYLSKAELSHLQFCTPTWQADPGTTRDVMEVITTLAAPDQVTKIIKWLVSLATDKRQSPQLISESLMSLRIMVQQHKIKEMTATLATLMYFMTSEQLLPSAKATIIWLFGTYCTQQPAMATELLRQMLPKLPTEVAVVRLQILQLAAKLYTAYRNDESQFDKRVPKFFEHAVHLCRYDQDVDVRDRTRLFSALLSVDNNSMATLLLQASKPTPTAVDIESSKSEFTIDSASALFGKRLDGYSDLENWADENSTNALREVSAADETSSEDDDVSAVGGSNASRTENVKPKKSPKSASSLNDVKAKMKKMSLEEFLGAPQKAGSGSNSAAEPSEQEVEKEEEEEDDDEEEEEEEEDEQEEDEIEHEDKDENGDDKSILKGNGSSETEHSAKVGK